LGIKGWADSAGITGAGSSGEAGLILFGAGYHGVLDVMHEGFRRMEFLKNYWPMLALALWFGYKWWNARRVVALLPALKQQGATLLDVRSVAEFASANATGTVPSGGGLRQWHPQWHGQDAAQKEGFCAGLQHRVLAQLHEVMLRVGHQGQWGAEMHLLTM